MFDVGAYEWFIVVQIAFDSQRYERRISNRRIVRKKEMIDSWRSGNFSV
jgi:hypothetical protein